MENLKEGIPKDYGMAQDFYDTARQVSMDTPENLKQREWTPEIPLIKRLLQIENIHLQEDTALTIVGSQVSWTILGEAFLFGATASLANTVQPNHYASLLIVISLMGVFLALYSFLHAIDTWSVMNRNRGLVHGMLNSKFAAYRVIIEHIKIKSPQDGEEYQLAMKEQFNAVKQECGINFRFFCHFIMSCFLLLISLLFLGIWVALLIFEVKSKIAGCSYWNKSPCMLCNTDSKADHENFLCMA